MTNVFSAKLFSSELGNTGEYIMSMAVDCDPLRLKHNTMQPDIGKLELTQDKGVVVMTASTHHRLQFPKNLGLDIFMAESQSYLTQRVSPHSPGFTVDATINSTGEDWAFHCCSMIKMIHKVEFDLHGIHSKSIGKRATDYVVFLEIPSKHTEESVTNGLKSIATEISKYAASSGVEEITEEAPKHPSLKIVLLNPQISVTTTTVDSGITNVVVSDRNAARILGDILVDRFTSLPPGIGIFAGSGTCLDGYSKDLWCLMGGHNAESTKKHDKIKFHLTFPCELKECVSLNLDSNHLSDSWWESMPTGFTSNTDVSYSKKTGTISWDMIPCSDKSMYSILTQIVTVEDPDKFDGGRVLSLTVEMDGDTLPIEIQIVESVESVRELSPLCKKMSELKNDKQTGIVEYFQLIGELPDIGRSPVPQDIFPALVKCSMMTFICDIFRHMKHEVYSVLGKLESDLNVGRPVCKGPLGINRSVSIITDHR